jgi:hypothetical protein
VVYKRRNTGNLSDGYLNVSSDSSVATSSPITGMDGPGPYLQQISGSFAGGGTFDPSGRFACFYRVSFWRTSAGIGPGGNSASPALTENVIEVSVTSGAIVLGDGRILTPADGTVVLTSTVPLVLSSDDPRTGDGSVTVALQCMNVETIFSIQARISWNVKQREHVLYGIVRECYEEENPCVEECSGSGTPDVVYVTISNYSGPTPDGTTLNGTYVLDRIPNNCYWWDGPNPDECLRTPDNLKWNYLYPNNFSIRAGRLFSGACYGVGFDVFTQVSWDLCLRGVIATGTNGTTKIAAFSGGYSIPMTGSPFTNSFDWKIEA